MIQLNLPPFEFSIKSEGQSKQIFDSFRKKYVELTPEEWVRQNFLRYLTEEKKFPASLIAVEIQIGVGKLKKRCDAVVYSKETKPVLIIECKAPAVKISQEVFDQAARYNLTLNVKYLALTNGFEHFFCRINTEKKSFEFIEEIPEYKLL
jgi:hypothetical protein